MQKKRVPLFWSKVCKSTVGRAYIRQLTYSPWVPLNFFQQFFVAPPTNCSGRRGCFFLELGRWRFPHHLSTIPILQFDERPHASFTVRHKQDLSGQPRTVKCNYNRHWGKSIEREISIQKASVPFIFKQNSVSIFLFPTVCDITNQVFQLWWSIIWFFAVTFLENNTSIIAIKFLNLPLWKSSARFEICPGFHIL